MSHVRILLYIITKVADLVRTPHFNFNLYSVGIRSGDNGGLKPLISAHHIYAEPFSVTVAICSGQLSAATQSTRIKKHGSVHVYKGMCTLCRNHNIYDKNLVNNIKHVIAILP